jgi:hypothetical protein
MFALSWLVKGVSKVRRLGADEKLAGLGNA